MDIKSLTCERKPLVQKIPCCLMSFCRDLKLDVLDNDGEGDHEDAHQKEEAIGDHIGQKHFTHCMLCRCCLVCLLLMSSLDI